MKQLRSLIKQSKINTVLTSNDSRDIPAGINVQIRQGNLVPRFLFVYPSDTFENIYDHFCIDCIKSDKDKRDIKNFFILLSYESALKIHTLFEDCGGYVGNDGEIELVQALRYGAECSIFFWKNIYRFCYSGGHLKHAEGHIISNLRSLKEYIEYRKKS